MGTSREIVLQFTRSSEPSLEPSPLSSVSNNIYSLHGTRVNWTQQFLIHHCKYASQLSAVLTMVSGNHFACKLGLHHVKTSALLFHLANAIAKDTLTPASGNVSCSPSCFL